MQEIYIRFGDEAEARGPFTVEQLADLAAVGRVSAQTKVYDMRTEAWVELGSLPDLMRLAFPEKKKLTFKASPAAPAPSAQPAPAPIKVDELLAAAEGRTAETAAKADPEVARVRAARIGLYGALAALAAAATGEIIPGLGTIFAAEGGGLLAHPFALPGLLDLGLAGMLALGVTGVYPLVRFRAALGLGLAGCILVLQGQSGALPLLALGCAGLYGCTIFTRLQLAVPSALAALAGWSGLSWLLLRA
jgi:hypothetical protein